MAWVCGDCAVQVEQDATSNPLLLVKVPEKTRTDGTEKCGGSRHDHGPLPGDSAWYGCCVCCTNRGLKPRWCRHCRAKWQALVLFEKAAAAACAGVTDGVKPSKDEATASVVVKEAAATRPLVGQVRRCVCW